MRSSSHLQYAGGMCQGCFRLRQVLFCVFDEQFDSPTFLSVMVRLFHLQACLSGFCRC